MRIRQPLRPRALFLTIGCIIVLLMATLIITAVAAQNSGVKPTVDPHIARLPPAKQTFAAPQQTKVAEYIAAHPEVKNVPATDTPGPPVRGIQDKYPNWWNIHLMPVNEWFGTMNGQAIEVFAGIYSTWSAGGTVEVPGQGYIAVGVGSDLSGPNRDYHEYLTPTKHGGLKITAVNGTQVSLVATDGTVYTFDLDTRTFS